MVRKGNSSQKRNAEPSIGAVKSRSRTCVKCEVCNKLFVSKYFLDMHTRVHTGDRPFKCGECGKAFSQKGNLKVHYRIHSGEKPYGCNQCQECFTQKNHLDNHHKVAHKVRKSNPNRKHIFKNIINTKCNTAVKPIKRKCFSKAVTAMKLFLENVECDTVKSMNPGRPKRLMSCGKPKFKNWDKCPKLTVDRKHICDELSNLQISGKPKLKNSNKGSKLTLLDRDGFSMLPTSVEPKSNITASTGHDVTVESVKCSRTPTLTIGEKRVSGRPSKLTADRKLSDGGLLEMEHISKNSTTIDKLVEHEVPNLDHSTEKQIIETGKDSNNQLECTVVNEHHSKDECCSHREDTVELQCRMCCNSFSHGSDLYRHRLLVYILLQKVWEELE